MSPFEPNNFCLKHFAVSNLYLENFPIIDSFGPPCIFNKRKALDLKLRKLYWLICRKSQLSLQNKLLLYKSILKPIWSYGIQFWGTSANSNIEILQRFQS